MKILKQCIIYTSLLIGTVTVAQDSVSDSEYAAFAQQKYRVDYYKQSDDTKRNIAQQANEITTLYKLVSPSINENIDLQMAIKLMTLDLWANKYMANVNPTDVEIKQMYDAQLPKIVTKYKLRNILVETESSADKLIKQLSSISSIKKRIEKVKELVRIHSIDLTTKTKEGMIGYIEANKLSDTIQKMIVDKKVGDTVKVVLPSLGTQIFFIEELIPQRTATIEESKDALMALIRQEKLKEHITHLLKEQNLK